jgi:hypothetical protein
MNEAVAACENPKKKKGVAGYVCGWVDTTYSFFTLIQKPTSQRQQQQNKLSGLSTYNSRAVW